MIEKIKKNIWKIYFKHFGSQVYLIKRKNQNILVDTSSIWNRIELLGELKKLEIEPSQINLILLTHKHFDHVGNIKIFKNAKIYGDKKDFPSKKIKDINELKLEGMQVIKTPGHTRGGLCFYFPKDKILFSGDTLFHKGIYGRTDFPGSSRKEMSKSLEKLKKIDYEILCPGHGVEE